MENIAFVKKEKLNLKNGLNSLGQFENVKVQFGNRDHVEKLNDCVQPVCAGILLTTNNKILVLKKTSKSTGKVSQEKNKSLLYVGGHLDKTDTNSSNLKMFENGMKREILEELGLILPEISITNPYVVYSPTTEKSAKHIGIIFPIVVEEFTPEFADGKAKFMDINDAKNLNNLEEWSKILLENLTRDKYIYNNPALK